jgi:hypothetical protein
MSDFKREELQSMLQWANVYCNFGHCWSYKLHKPLIDKIQLMIDNSCEPEDED